MTTSRSPESKAEAVISAWTKRWSYWEPNTDEAGNHYGSRFVVLSEHDILAQTYDWWSERCRAVGREDLINERNCIEDWVIVHWAQPYE